MANIYVWQFESLDVYPAYQSLTDVVQSVHWRMFADDGSGHTSQAYGEEVMGPPDPGNFIPFAELTSSVVQGWVEAVMGTGLAALKAHLDWLISVQVSPTIVSMVPPWT